MSHPMRPKITRVVVEYNDTGRRSARTFYSDRKAKEFYKRMALAGRLPKIIKAELNGGPGGT